MSTVYIQLKSNENIGYQKLQMFSCFPKWVPGNKIVQELYFKKDWKCVFMTISEWKLSNKQQKLAINFNTLLHDCSANMSKGIGEMNC